MFKKIRIAIIKFKLNRQPKIQVIIPLKKGEKFGTTLLLNIKGHHMNILKDTIVLLPKQVAEYVIKNNL